MYEVSELYEPVGEFWLCAGACGDWRKGMAAAYNGSGYVCRECEQKRLDGLNPEEPPQIPSHRKRLGGGGR